MIYEYARPARAFVDSVGVVTHLRYSDKVYWDYNLVKSVLLDLGVKHIRDEVVDSWSKQTVLDRFKDLGLNGVKLTLLSTPMIGNTPEGSRDMAIQVKDVLAAIEGPNEWSDNGHLYKGLAFPSGLALYQEDLYKAIKSTAALKGIPVIAPSTYDGTQARRMATTWFPGDYANVHSYPGGQPPSEGRLSYGYYLDWNRITCIGKPWVATETGYNYAVDNTSNPWHTPVNDAGGGRYTNRLIFEYFNRNCSRTFIYELFDQGADTVDPEATFGLVRNDGSRKPSFVGLKNTLALLQEPTTAAALWPRYLAYNMSAPSSIRKTILQKADGRFYVVLWDDVKSYDPYTKTTIATAWKTVTLSFPKQYGTAKVYRPLDGATAINTYSNITALTVSVPDYPVIVELAP